MAYSGGKVIRQPTCDLPPRYTERQVEMVLPRRDRSKTGEPAAAIDWLNCPLAQRYPTWDVWHEALANEREHARATGAEASVLVVHPRQRPVILRGGYARKRLTDAERTAIYKPENRRPRTGRPVGRPKGTKNPPRLPSGERPPLPTVDLSTVRS